VANRYQAGADRVMTLDMHAGQIQGSSSTFRPDNSLASPVMVTHREHCDITDGMVVSPESRPWCGAGPSPNASRAAGVIDKRATRRRIRSHDVIGDVAAYTCLLVDDIGRTPRHPEFVMGW